MPWASAAVAVETTRSVAVRVRVMRLMGEWYLRGEGEKRGKGASQAFSAPDLCRRWEGNMPVRWTLICIWIGYYKHGAPLGLVCWLNKCVAREVSLYAPLGLELDGTPSVECGVDGSSRLEISGSS